MLPIWTRICPRPAKIRYDGSVSLPYGGDAEPLCPVSCWSSVWTKNPRFVSCDCSIYRLFTNHKLENLLKEGDAMRILVIEPERRPEVREIDGSLKTMQSIVGGYIQAIYPFDDPVALVANDDGKLWICKQTGGCGIRMGRYTILWLAHSSFAAHPQTATILSA